MLAGGGQERHEGEAMNPTELELTLLLILAVLVLGMCFIGYSLDKIARELKRIEPARATKEK